MKTITDLRAVITLFAVLIGCIAQNTPGENRIALGVNEAEKIIPQELFGVLMEQLGRQWKGQGAIFVGTNSSIENTNGMRQDVIDGFIECGVGAIEWPGGCAANDYDWSTNRNSSTGVGVDRFVEFCRLTNAEAVICGRPTANDAGSNEAFCRYILEDLDYPLKWFKVGNEVWGCGGNQTVNTYMPNYTASYNRLKDLKNHKNGKNLSIVAGNDIEGEWAWLPAMLNSIGETIDGVEYHDYIYYPNEISSANPSTADYWKILGDAVKNDVLSHVDKNVIPAMDSYDPEKRIPVVLDEWGDWLMDTGDNWMQKATLMDALSAAAHLNLFIQRCDRIGVACMAQGVSVIHSLMNINTSGQMVRTPSFYVFKMFRPHHEGNAKFIPVTSMEIDDVNSIPCLTVGASVDDSNIVNLSFSNIDLSASQSVAVTLNGDVEEYRVKSAEIVTGDNFRSGNDFGKDEDVFIETLNESSYTVEGNLLTAKLPPKSVVMIRLISAQTSLRRKAAFRDGTATFSVAAVRNGLLILNSTVSRPTPVNITLYSIDGKVVADKVYRKLLPGKSAEGLEFTATGSGAFIVEIDGPGISCSQKIAVRK